MTRREALGLVVAGLVAVVVGLAWAVGPWGLVAGGVVAAGVGLFGVDVREEVKRAEPVDPATAGTGQERRGPVFVQRLG